MLRSLRRNAQAMYIGALGQLVAVYFVLYGAHLYGASLKPSCALGQLVAVYLVLYVAGFEAQRIGELGLWLRTFLCA